MSSSRKVSGSDDKSVALAPFYVLIILLIILSASVVLGGFGDSLHNLIAKIILNVISFLLLAVDFVAAVMMLNVLAKSIKEDKASELQKSDKVPSEPPTSKQANPNRGGK